MFFRFSNPIAIIVFHSINGDSLLMHSLLQLSGVETVLQQLMPLNKLEKVEPNPPVSQETIRMDEEYSIPP